MATEWEYYEIRITPNYLDHLNKLGLEGWQGWAVFDDRILLMRQVVPPPVNPNQAVAAILTLGGYNMAGQITVDTTNETATVQFVDDKGDLNAAAPAGAVVTFTSDTPAVATVAPDATNPLQGDISPLSEGVVNIGATIADASGNPIMEPDGTTPFVVASVAVTVGAGEAQGAALVLSV